MAFIALVPPRVFPRVVGYGGPQSGSGSLLKAQSVDDPDSALWPSQARTDNRRSRWLTSMSSRPLVFSGNRAAKANTAETCTDDDVVENRRLPSSNHVDLIEDVLAIFTVTDDRDVTL